MVDPEVVVGDGDDKCGRAAATFEVDAVAAPVAVEDPSRVFRSDSRRCL